MKSTFFNGTISIAILAFLLVVTSGLAHPRAAFQKGDLAPEILIETPTDTLDLSSLRGENVLLTFWSSSNAQSRVECNMCDAWFKAQHPAQMRHVAINFDEHTPLFEEIIRRDHLDSTSQYHADGREASQIMEAYHLDDTFGSVLIGPDGRIIEINPTTTELSTLM